MTMFFKTILLLAFALLSPTATAWAQATADSADTIQTQLKETLTRLNLSDEQRDPVETILRTDFEARRALMRQYGIDPANPGANRLSRRTKRKLAGEMNDHRTDAREQLEAVLTPEQMATWSALEEARQKQMRKRMRGR
jgi:Spy/CpxP family protein refolding chaperone